MLVKFGIIKFINLFLFFLFIFLMYFYWNINMISDFVYASSFSYISFSCDHALSHPVYFFASNILVWVHFTIIVNSYPRVRFVVAFSDLSFFCILLVFIFFSQLLIVSFQFLSPIWQPLLCFLFSFNFFIFCFLLFGPLCLLSCFVGYLYFLN